MNWALASGDLPGSFRLHLLEDAREVGSSKKALVAAETPWRDGVGGQAESRARPLARRDFNTRRPPLVAMRARNP